MDFQVEATIHLDSFQDKVKVIQILRSHDFVTDHHRGNELRVKGGFLGLKSVKAQLEQLLQAQSPTDVCSSSRPASPGAVPKNHYGSISAAGGARIRSGSRDKLPHASVSSPSTSTSPLSGSSHYHPASCPARSDQRGSVSHRHETLLVEGDVFRYAEQVRQKDLNDITERHNVALRVNDVGESLHITLKGENATAAAGELQSLLSHLHTSLRTQEVPRKDIGPKGHAVLQGIWENRSIYGSVLVCDMNDRLHLIGPSTESYELKQTLLEKSGRTGRKFDGGSNRTSSSLPAVRQSNADGGGGARVTPKQMMSRFKGLFKKPR